MTSEAQSLDPPTRIEDLPRILNAEHEPEPGPDGLDPAGSKHPGLSGRRGNGTVARSPKALRDQINIMIRDGVRYDEIIRRLGDAGKHLKPDHIKEWKKHGYQDWLLEQDWLDRLRSKAEFSDDILAAPSSANLHEAGLRIAASQMFDQLMRFNAASENGAADQPEKFARLVNALSRLTREALAFQKYRDALAKAIVQLEQRDPDRDLVASELRLLVNKMDKTFKVARPELAQLLASAGAAGAPLAGPKSPRPPRQPEGLADGSRRSEPAQTSGTVPANPPHPGLSRRLAAPKSDEGGSSERRPEGLPDQSPSASAGPLPSAGALEAPPSPGGDEVTRL